MISSGGLREDGDRVPCWCERSRKDEGSVRQPEQLNLPGLSHGLHTGNSTEESTFGSDVLISNPEKECQNIILGEV